MCKALITHLSSSSVPRKVQEVLSDSKWKEDINEEMNPCIRMKCGILLIYPKENPMVCKWVFTINNKADGLIERYKARLVAKGYMQTSSIESIDKLETFASVANMNSIEVLLSWATNLDWPKKQFDVKNAFLHGNLEEVFMGLPPCFEGKFSSDKVFRSKKKWYDLKQSFRAWFERFVKFLLKFGYHQS